MSKPSMFLKSALVLSLTLCWAGALTKTGVGFAKTPSVKAAPEKAQNKCANTTDAEIVAALNEKIKADKRFDDQWKHINVSSKNRVVTLRGWAKGQAQVDDLIKFARATKCVKRVISKLKPRRTLGCPPGLKPCGDTCIGKDEECNPIGN